MDCIEKGDSYGCSLCLFLIFRLFLSHFPSRRMKNRKSRAHGISSSDTSEKYTHRYFLLEGEELHHAEK